MRRRGVAVEMRDREIIGALHVTLLDLSRRPGRGIIGLFTKAPKTLLESVATQEEAVSTEVWFANSYPEYFKGTNPHRTSDDGTWRLRETTKIYNEQGNEIMGYKSKYNFRRKNNGGSDQQGPTWSLREYTYKPRGLNEQSLCIIYEKKTTKKKPIHDGEGVDQVQSEPDHEEAPVLLQISGAANPNSATGPSTAPLTALEVVPMASPNPNFDVVPPFPAEPAIKSPEEVEEAWYSDEDASKYGWFGFGDMSTYDLGSLDFIGGGCKHNEQSVCVINEKSPKKKPIQNVEGVLQFETEPEDAPLLQMATTNPKYDLGSLDFSDEG